MSLKQEIERDFKLALKNKQTEVLSVLRLLKTSILNREKEKRVRILKQSKSITESELTKQSSLTDQEIIDLIYSEIKKRTDSIKLYRKGGREELAKKEQAEIEILKKYLPKQASATEIEKSAQQVIEKLKAKSIADMGKVMKEMMSKFKGKAEPQLIAKIVKDLLLKKAK